MILSKKVYRTALLAAALAAAFAVAALASPPRALAYTPAYTVTVPTSVAYQKMPAGSIHASRDMAVTVGGDFAAYGSVRVCGSDSDLSPKIGSSMLHAALASTSSPILFGEAGSKADTITISGTAFSSDSWSGRSQYSSNLVAGSYTVGFASNGGTGYMDPVVHLTTDDWVVPTGAFSRKGYAFTGWNTAADGSGTGYAAGSSVGMLAPSGTVVLYAQWKVLPAKLTIGMDFRDAIAKLANGSARSTDYLIEHVRFFSNGDSPDGVDLSALPSAPVDSLRQGLATAYWDASSKTVYVYSIGPLRANDSCTQFFAGLKSLKEADFKGIDMSGVSQVSSMFDGCSSLASIDLSGLDAANVSMFTYMFEDCSSLASIDLSPLKPTCLESTYAMFLGCSSLKAIDLSGLDTSNVMVMTQMFYGCSSLASINLSGFSTSGAWRMNDMFSGCSKLASIDTSGWNTAACTDLSGIFQGCSSLKSVDVSGWNTAACTTFRNMFYGCSSLASIDVSRWNTAASTDFGSLFDGCSSLASIDVSRWNTAACASFCAVFEGCSSLASIDVSGWNTAASSNFSEVFEGCSILKSVDLSGWNTAAGIDFSHMFDGCSSMSSLGLSSFNTAKATSMRWMFANCSSLERIYVSGSFSVASVTSSDWMFGLDYKLAGSNGAGIAYDTAKVDKTYATWDGTGYFTLKS